MKDLGSSTPEVDNDKTAAIVLGFVGFYEGFRGWHGQFYPRTRSIFPECLLPLFSLSNLVNDERRKHGTLPGYLGTAP